ncbi:MAG: hypothetical protein KBD78_00930 [Oligoflexales bacterium]|nr:hypothetical protein [Oligoflexales bacterium]
MRTKVLLIAGILSFAAQVPQVFACSVLPFDAQAKAKEIELSLVKAAAATFAEDLTNIEFSPTRHITWLSVSGDYIWNSPMCPEGWEIKGEMAIDYYPNGTFPSVCRANVEVERAKTSPNQYLIGAQLENKLSLKLVSNVCKNLEYVLH